MKDFYKQKIIEMVREMENQELLISIYSFIMGMTYEKEKQETD